MEPFSFAKTLMCRTCGRSYPLSPMLEGCPDCRVAGRIAMLDPTYALDAADGGMLPAAPGHLWDYHRLLPLPDAAAQVTLGEGGTPLLPLPGMAAETGAAHVYIKYEAINPTHSFKDRANAVAVSMAKYFNLGKVMCTSTGNHGVALAAYAARAGLRCLVLLPPGAPPAAAVEIRFYGADAVMIDGDVVPLMTRLWREHDWYVSQRNAPGVAGRPFGNPFGMEGYKTIAYEIFQQLGRVPDRVFMPVGGGDGAWGIYKGFDELQRIGATTSVPRIVVCQSAAGAPLVNAYRNRLAQVATVPASTTIAFSIVDRHSGDHALWAIQRSNGQAVEVTDEQLREAEAVFGRTGICVEPSSAASLAGLRRLARSDERFDSETVVLIGTGAGLRWPATFDRVAPPPRAEASLESLGRVIEL
ncbi:MAG TPA: pyridoxal-phosphate dependent enzyme [bacterium]|nr:pyridoxal-phosphate dependent enzyme [bacterium]